MALRLIYRSCYKRVGIIAISEFMFDGETHTYVENLGLDENKNYHLKCKCGSNDWVDNGRDINEYECNVCGQFVTVLEDDEGGR